MRGITILAMDRLQGKLEQPAVSDTTVLKAMELGAKSLGLGNNAPPPSATGDHLNELAGRLLSLQAGVRKQASGEVYENAVIVSEDSQSS